MIKRININNLGVFNNFKWSSVKDSGNTVVDFKKVNIIYGRNYSGKTTFSRIVRALETKELSDKYENPDFEVIADGVSNVTFSNFTRNALKIRCFNEDFIKENLRFVISGEDDIKSFAILGDNGDIEEQINVVKDRLGVKDEGNETKLYNDYKNALGVLDEAKKQSSTLQRNLEDQLKEKATGKAGIKSNHAIYDDINYNITKLKMEMVEILDDPALTIDDETKRVNEKLIQEVEKDNLPFFTLHSSEIDSFFVKTEELISKPILGTFKIQQLVDNALVNSWVKQGKKLHEDHNLKECGFCGTEITNERWSKLEKHFDEETQKLENGLYALRSSIQDEITKISSVVDNIDESKFYANYQAEVIEVKGNYAEIISAYITELEVVIPLVNQRISHILTPIAIGVKSEFDSNRFSEIVVALNKIVQKHKDFTNSLASQKSIAKKELRLLSISEFIATIKYEDQESGIKTSIDALDVLESDVEKVSLEIDRLEEEIKELTRKMNDEEAGAIKVNDYLTNYFGHNNLKLEAIKEEIGKEKKIRFNIVRNGKIAYHLSEGECSLIAFCYFMAKLDDIHTASHKPILFIDDPISSLDANHIFFTYSLINSELFLKNRFEQIFLSTHNLDFLKYLKKLKLEQNNSEFFIINRLNNNNSIIALMPRYLKDYVTEFNYLFDQIHKCAKAEIITDDNHHVFYNFGNNARKFLEALLFYKYPSRIDNQTRGANSKRLLKYFGADNQATILTDRVNNELSHLEEIFDRGMTPIEIPEIKKVAQFILDKIEEKDQEQYQALLESIGFAQNLEVVVNPSLN